MVAPGACLSRLLARNQRSIYETLLAGVLISPLLLVFVTIATLSAGGTVPGASHALAATSAILLATALLRRPAEIPPVRREVVWMLVLVVGLLLLTATLPFTREWWRIRSDAWFHAAVVAEMRDFGLPPDDPYFVGMPLQYMWFYHVVGLVLSDALRVDAFWVMASFNAHAVVALVLASFQLASVLRPGFAHRMAATATLIFAFNAAFWVFLPLKLVRAVTGEVRGWEEIQRTYTLSPLNYDTAYGFMNIYCNQEFFLDKFMVATAFGIALVYMVAAWAGAIDWLQNRRRYGLALVAVSLVGMLGFHSMVGFVFLVGVVGGAVLLHLTRARVDGYRRRAAVALVGTSLLCLVGMTPYLYRVMHAKEQAQVFPVDFSLPKIAGIFISCAFVMVMSWRARAFWLGNSVGLRFFVLGAAAVTAFCFSIALPGPNTYDKLGYFVFIPFAVMAGFAVADSILARPARARLTTALVWITLFYLPVNAIAFVSSFATPDGEEVTPAEMRLSDWVRDHTPRESVLIDDHDRVPLVVTAPRRYFFGRLSYAEQWGYDKVEMSRREHVVRSLYGDAPLDADALDALASFGDPLFVVVRPEHRERAVARHPELFETMFSDPEISLVRVDRNACLAVRRRSE
jgi:hypothetical protein